MASALCSPDVTETQPCSGCWRQNLVGPNTELVVLKRISVGEDTQQVGWFPRKREAVYNEALVPGTRVAYSLANPVCPP